MLTLIFVDDGWKTWVYQSRPCKFGEVTESGDSFLTKVSPEVSIDANGGIIVESDQQVQAQSSALSELALQKHYARANMLGT